MPLGKGLITQRWHYETRMGHVMRVWSVRVMPSPEDSSILNELATQTWEKRDFGNEVPYFCPGHQVNDAQ